MTTNVADGRGRRLDAATGVLAAVLFLAGFLIQTKPPVPDDPVAKIAGYFTDHRSAILVGDFLIAAGSAVFIWFLGSLRSYLRAGEGGEGRLSAASFLGGGVVAAMLLGGAAMQAGLVLHANSLGDSAVIRAGFDTYNAVFTVGGAALAVAIAAASCSAARSGALPPSAFWSGSIIAGLQIVSLAALFAKKGFFAAGGAMTLIAFVTAVAWYIAVALLIVRRQGLPPTLRTAP
ncbi:MAG: hypothetical protein ACJ76Z_07925 [Thermoleophilaceae bacterium]